jgi:ADP-heptose:LPS heptosyltransferase
MYPDAEITVLVRKYNYAIVKNLPYIDRVIKIDEFKRNELIKKIAYFKADIFIALYNDAYISKLARASKAKIRIGPFSKIYSFFSFNKGVWQKRSKSLKNEAEYNLDLIKKIDDKKYKEKFEINTEIFLTEDNIQVANLFYEQNNIKGQSLVINPFMGGSAKNLRDEEYASIVKKIIDQDDSLSVIILCHISETERGERLLNIINRKRVYLFANGGDLLNIAGIIDKATLYFGGSTGPTHLAGALKKDIVAIYPKLKTQSPTRWGIFNNKKVDYIIIDEYNIKEDYSHKNFDSYNEEVENKIISKIKEKLMEQRD